MTGDKGRDLVINRHCPLASFTVNIKVMYTFIVLYSEEMFSDEKV